MSSTRLRSWVSGTDDLLLFEALALAAALRSGSTINMTSVNLSIVALGFASFQNEIGQVSGHQELSLSIHLSVHRPFPFLFLLFLSSPWWLITSDVLTCAMCHHGGTCTVVNTSSSTPRISTKEDKS